MTSDPDDYRPNTTWAMVLDPETSDGRYVRDMTILFEHCAIGDRIPLHTHTIDEAIVIDQGTADVTLGDETSTASTGAVVFIPAGVRHGARNTGREPLQLHAFFATTVLDAAYLERNPAPGTEGEPPEPPLSIDVRSLPAE